jgi:uncharacterized metal-binding protein YceD (DUF177 family)
MPATRTPSNTALPISLPFRTGALSLRKPQQFDLAPAKADRVLLAALLGISAIHHLRFKGEIRSAGRQDFVLEGELTARVEQPCGLTLAPVVTDIRETVQRRYLAGLALPEADEVEIPAEDDAEPLPEVIDAGAVAAEALALALPLYPRAPGAELPAAVFGPPGVEPLQDRDLKPFAGLANLTFPPLSVAAPDKAED